MDLHDTTDYRFTAGSRQLLVRQGTGTSRLLPKVAKEHAEQLRTLLNSRDIAVSKTLVLPGGTRAVTVTARVPQDPAEGGPDQVERTAFLSVGGSTVAQVTLLAPADDTGAEAEFRRLAESVQTAPTGTAQESVRRTLAAGPDGRAAYPVGNLTIDLTADYRAPAAYTLATADRSVSHTVERAAAAATARAALPATRGADTGTVLNRGSVGVALDEQGRPVRYETGPRPPQWGGGPAAAPPGGGVRGPGVGAAAPEQPADVAATVAGTPVVIRTTARGVAARAAAEALARELQHP